MEPYRAVDAQVRTHILVVTQRDCAIMRSIPSVQFVSRAKTAGVLFPIRLSAFGLMVAFLLCSTALPRLVAAETGAEGWLRYAPLDRATAKQYERLPVKVVVLGDSIVLTTAGQE